MKFRVFWDICCVVTEMSTDVSELRAAYIIRAMMKAARTSETSADICDYTSVYPRIL
jgi:hypothetical protein